MNTIRQSKTLLAIFALLLIFGACKGESPTAPPTGGGGNPPGGGGTTPPPAGVQLTLTASNASPLVDSTVTVTATVTQDGQPVPNGTAVEFSTTAGGLEGTAATSIIRTTTNGVATVTLTASAAGPARITAVVNNVLRTVDVTFQPRPIVVPPVNTDPVIDSVSPATGRPAGGQTIRITGRNFAGPLRVLFEPANGAPIEAFVVSSTETTIDVVTPGVNLAVGQELAADIVVVTQAGTATERRAERTGAFTYTTQQLTPRISTATPNSGPVVGGTQVEIFGDGFESPVQVLFGAAEARVISVEFGRIQVEAPTARDTSSDGSGVVTGPVDITVRNINSQTFAVLPGGFRYVSAVQITAAGPTEGPFTGGTRVEIDGVGFVGPVAVSIGGVAAQPVFVSSTKVIALTSGIALDSCADVTGPITVTNIINGDTATGPDFIFRVLRPTILSVSDTSTLGGPITVTVANAIGTPRLRLGDTSLSITNAVDNGNGTTTFTAIVPMTIPLVTEACPGVAGVTRRLPTAFDVTYTSTTTTCTDTLQNGATVVPPPNSPSIAVSPVAGFTPFTATITPGTPGNPSADPPVPSTPPSVAPSAPQTVSIVNSGTGTLTITSVTASSGCASFAIATPTTPANLLTCDTFAISAVYEGSTTPSAQQCTLTVVTNAGTRTLTLSGNSQ